MERDAKVVTKWVRTMIAFVFPGQGSQYSGMGRDVAKSFPEAREVFEEADEGLGFPLSQLCFEGSKRDLQLTENTQPAILATSTALFRVLQDKGKAADFVAGHSLGEYSALVAANGIRFRDAVRLVRQRGRFMQEAVPIGKGAMAVILGLDLCQVQEVCQAAAQGEVVAPANVNAPDQVVVAGHSQAVGRAGDIARERGAKRVLPLPVSAPFHCSLMKPAEIRLAEAIRQVPFCDLSVPLVNNVEAQVVSESKAVQEGLVKQVSSVVLWSDCVKRLVASGVSTFVEVGPGRVLTGLIRRIAPTVEAISIQSREQLEDYV